MPVGGAADAGAHTLANALVGNSADAATLELTQVGGTFEALQPLLAALAGAPFEASIERAHGSSVTLLLPRSFELHPGDRLIVRRCDRGARAYLALHGGVLTEPVLGSRSSETPVRAGDVVPADESSRPACWPARDHTIPFDSIGDGSSNRCVLRVVDGTDGRARPGEFVVDEATSRMGVRLLASAPLDAPDLADAGERLSAPVAPGAIQWTPSGLILLGVACGTMGGYAHVAHLISADLDKLGQLRPGDPIALEPVSLSDARRLDAAQREARRRAALQIKTFAAATLSK